MNQILQDAITEYADEAARTRQQTRAASENYITNRFGADALNHMSYSEDQGAWHLVNTNLYLKYEDGSLSTDGQSGLFLHVINNRFVVGKSGIKVRNLKTLGEALAELQESHGNKIQIA